MVLQAAAELPEGRAYGRDDDGAAHVSQRSLQPARYRPAVVKLYVLDDLYAVVRCDPDAPVPGWASGGHFWSVTRTDSELSVVGREDDRPAEASAERGSGALEP